MVLQACMLGGCDCLSNLRGLDLKSAIGVMKKKCKEMTRENDYLEAIKKPKTLEYIQRFCKAMNTYRHQRVYDPAKKTIVCLEDFPDVTEDDEPYIGREEEHQLRIGLVRRDHELYLIAFECLYAIKDELVRNSKDGFNDS
ncbi:exonuclease 1-like protein [Tanacetum coccineum]|uniref:Exonuclease 1-like protein n=1 Tax=Tanacetum coccineum TaxID=301880 RepID=A0ABQ5AT35_9ASTR